MTSSWLADSTRRGCLGRSLLRAAGRCRSGRFDPGREVKRGEVRGGPRPAMRAHRGPRVGRPGPSGSRASRRTEVFSRSTGSGGLRRVPLGVSQLPYGDGKLGKLRNEHQHLGLVLVPRGGEQPGRGPQSISSRCGPRDATVAAASRPGVAVCCLLERPAAQAPSAMALHRAGIKSVRASWRPMESHR